MDETIYDTIIIGSGPAGLTAAIYNVRADLKTIVLAGEQPGGQLTITTAVDNWPGFPTGIGGTKLMMDMQKQVQNLGVTIKQGLVTNISKGTNPSKSPPDKPDSKALTKGDFGVTLQSGETLKARAVILATGAKAKWIGLPNEKEMIGKGVSGCATCDGFFFRDKIVTVVGGGDTACEDAVFLSKFASKVYMIHRRDEFRAAAIEQKKVFANPKIEVIWNTEVKEIKSGEKLEEVVLLNNKTQVENNHKTDGLFVAIGHSPATEFAADLVKRDENGFVVIGENQTHPFMTSAEGVFAAGDATTINRNFRQAIAAAGDGCKAGLDAEKWLGEQR